MNRLLRGDLALPFLVQAPMAGVSTPALAAAVSNAGALGSVALGACSSPQHARELLQKTRELTDRPFSANVFCHRVPVDPKANCSSWLRALAPLFPRVGAAAPYTETELKSGYTSFLQTDAMLNVLLDEKPRVVSFHFGLPPSSWVKQLQDAGIVTLACVTSLKECDLAVQAGVDAVVAQGNEAGGHRGVFDGHEDLALGTLALVRLLSKSGRCPIPIVAAGGIMDGAGIAAALQLGASAVQMGTAFVLCPETSANAAYRKALSDPERAANTRVAAAISGRSARGLVNPLMTFLEDAAKTTKMPEYPIPYTATKMLLAQVAKSEHESDKQELAVHWAGQGAPLARAMPARELVLTLAKELEEAQTLPRL